MDAFSLYFNNKFVKGGHTAAGWNNKGSGGNRFVNKSSDMCAENCISAFDCTIFNHDFRTAGLLLRSLE